MVLLVSSIWVVMLRTWEVRLKKANSNLAFRRCSLIRSWVSVGIGFSHLHCIRVRVFSWWVGWLRVCLQQIGG